MAQVIDKYQLEEEYDKEAFGVIYKARDLQTEEIVELGIIDSGLGEYKREIEEILGHKHVITKIHHENIARLHDFFRYENSYVLVREHTPSSESLSHWISSKTYSFQEIGNVINQVCDALEYAYDQGVVYNYITPSTIKIDGAGKIKITNLGFSRLFRASYSGSDSIIESANFLSPEHIQELPGDVRSDVYSLGVLLYFMLTKSLPFPGKNFAKIIALKVREMPSSPEQIDPRVPKMLSEVVMEAMQPERESRFADLDEFRGQLSAALKQAERGATGRHVGQKFGNYEVIEILGHGAHSTVFKAIDTRFKKLVALKMLDYRLSMDEQFVKRFDREGIISERLHHENIVGIIEKFEDGDFFFLAIEYVEGVPLEKLFEDDAPLPFEKTYKIFKQICEAFSYVHEQGVVHRDIKPSNIMINPDGKVKVLDFGIAKILDEATESLTKSPIGTPQYMSPEQCSTGEVDARSDIYSLGALLFKMVTGRVPFRSDKLHVLLKMHISETPPVPSSLNPAIPDKMDAIILRALKKNKEERFSTAREMLGEFLSAMKPMMTTGLVGKSIGGFEIMSVGKRKGGMAETFIGKDTTTNNLVFIKILQQDLSADEMFRERFLREIAVLKKMDHPNIVKVIDVVEEEDTVYLVMTFVIGKDLHQVLSERKRLLPPQALPIFRQICDAIEYAHNQGIVHRDIKPANIMIEPSGKVYVLDFGIAKILDPGTTTLTTMPIGTPAYMSPEQFTLDTITPQSDIYSLGVLLYELLCGSKPFAGETGGYQQKHLKEPPVPLNKRVEIEKKISKIVLKALEKKPGDRYPNVGKFRDELDKAVRRYYVEKASIEVKHNASENLQTGDSVAFEVKAPPDGLVRVKVDGLDDPILLKESTSKPGVYLGSYTVKEADRIEKGEVTALYDYSRPYRIDQSGVQTATGAKTVVATGVAKERVRIGKPDPEQLLRTARGHVEGKRYRKALKAAEEIIKNFPALEAGKEIKRICQRKLYRSYLQVAGSLVLVFAVAMIWPAYTHLKNPIAYEAFPADGTPLTVKEGESVALQVKATSGNEGDLGYQWSVDDRLQTETGGSSYTYTPDLNEAGERSVVVKITDARMRTRTHEWKVNVLDAVPDFVFDKVPGTTYNVSGGEEFKVAIERINFPSPDDLRLDWFVGGSKHEQGDPAKGLTYKTDYTDKGVKMISLIVSSDELANPMEMDWTLNVLPVDTLTRVSVDPEPGSAVSLRIGTDEQTFIAKYQQRNNQKIDYTWQIDGKKIPGATSGAYTYKSTSNDKDPKELVVRVSDGLTNLTDKWRIMFEEYNPLHIPMWKPQAKKISLQEGDEQTFSVVAEHDWENAKIAYDWSMSVDGRPGNITEKGSSFNFRPGFDFVKEGQTREVKVQVVARDDHEHALKPISWEINVANRPVLQEGPSPAEGSIVKQEGETLVVKAPSKTLTGAKPINKWTFRYGGKDISAEGDTFKHQFEWDKQSDGDTRGSLVLSTEAAPDGKKEWKWDVLVKNRKYVNNPPIIDDFGVSKAAIKEGESATFSVKAHDPDPEQKLSYEFYFEDDPKTILPASDNRYTYKTDFSTVRGAGTERSTKRTLVARVTDTGEMGRQSTIGKREITIENAIRNPSITEVLLNGAPVKTNARFDLEDRLSFKASASDPDESEGDKLSFQWKVNGKPENSQSQWQWTPPATGQYSFNVTVKDNAGKTDERSWNIVIASEKDQMKQVLEKMQRAYENLDYAAMRSLCLQQAYPEIELLQNTMSRSDVSGLMIEYEEPRLSGDRAEVTARMLKWKHYRKGWQDYPQEIEKVHKLRKQDGVWKYESLQLK